MGINALDLVHAVRSASSTSWYDRRDASRDVPERIRKASNYLLDCRGRIRAQGLDTAFEIRRSLFCSRQDVECYTVSRLRQACEASQRTKNERWQVVDDSSPSLLPVHCTSTNFACTFGSEGQPAARLCKKRLLCVKLVGSSVVLSFVLRMYLLALSTYYPGVYRTLLLEIVQAYAR